MTSSRICPPLSAEYKWVSGVSTWCFGFALHPFGPAPGPLVIKSPRTKASIKDHCSGCVPKWNCTEGRETLVLCSYELKITLPSWDYLSPLSLLLIGFVDLLTGNLTVTIKESKQLNQFQQSSSPGMEMKWAFIPAVILTRYLKISIISDRVQHSLKKYNFIFSFRFPVLFNVAAVQKWSVQHLVFFLH